MNFLFEFFDYKRMNVAKDNGHYKCWERPYPHETIEKGTPANKH
jgi:hypothetical protein